MNKNFDKILREFNQTHMDGAQGHYFTLDESKLTVRPDQRWWMEAHRQKAIEMLNFQQADHFVDMGCGEGFLTLAFTPLVTQTIGLDVADTALKILRQQPHFDPSNTLPSVSQGDAFPLPNNWADKLFCNHTLEHVLDDDAFLQEMYRVVRPGGHILIGVPLALNWQIKSMLRIRRRLLPNIRQLQLEKVTPGKLVPELIGVTSHIRFYDISSLRNLLERNGFVVQNVAGVGFGIPQIPVRRFIRRHRLLFNSATWLGKRIPTIGDGVLMLGQKR